MWSEADPCQNHLEHLLKIEILSLFPCPLNHNFSVKRTGESGFLKTFPDEPDAIRFDNCFSTEQVPIAPKILLVTLCLLL